MPVITENSLPFTGRLSLKGKNLLREVVSQINTFINKKGRVITLFRLNGTEYDLSRTLPEIMIDEMDEVAFQSSSPLDLAKQSLDDAVSQFQSFDSLINSIINDLIRGDRQSAFKKFGEFLGEFRDMIRCLQTIEVTFGLNYEEIKVNDKSIKVISENMVKILTEMKNAMNNEDYVTLTDLLEYEIKEMFSGDLRKSFEELSRILACG